MAGSGGKEDEPHERRAEQHRQENACRRRDEQVDAGPGVADIEDGERDGGAGKGGEHHPHHQPAVPSPGELGNGGIIEL